MDVLFADLGGALHAISMELRAVAFGSTPQPLSIDALVNSTTGVLAMVGVPTADGRLLLMDTLVGSSTGVLMLGVQIGDGGALISDLRIPEV